MKRPQISLILILFFYITLCQQPFKLSDLNDTNEKVLQKESGKLPKNQPNHESKILLEHTWAELFAFLFVLAAIFLLGFALLACNSKKDEYQYPRLVALVNPEKKNN
ncbi:hypothetical protein M0812_14471 [Anaeramoeba flamelloides]|uniref:Uncharacterized protein n=1 Tax=Anaeramoeba flamelloides TaxID=1746091 RepID=A0AAV7ZFI6_9EUKA|nr:hypothetical protein M0812_14471 [Anaeramoeba flamelloides]